MTAVDSGPLVALFDRGDNHHQRAMRYFEATTSHLVTNIAVLTEVSHLLDFDRRVVCDFIGWAGKSLDVDGATPGDIARIVEIMAKYADLPADFADASLVALCERQRITQIATFDRDFDIYRLADGKQLSNVMEMR